MTTKFDSISDMVDTIEVIVYDTVRSSTEITSAKSLGLDERAAHELFVDQNYIIIEEGNRGKLDYYGGFEYVDSSCVQVIGGFVFYSAQDERVQDHLDHFFHPSEDEDDFNSVTSREHY